MFALGIELLMRRAIMTRWDNRDEPEWPPHPDRVFMALVAAWGECGEDAAQRAAVEWLETLGPPAIRVSIEASVRSAVTSYVPANDVQSPTLRGKTPTSGQIADGIAVLPERRGKNARSFPTAIPAESTFHFVWADAVLDPKHTEPLTALCGQVTYLGHSATPIQMWIEESPVDPNLLPGKGPSAFRLRVFGPGRLANLESRFNRIAIDDHEQLSRLVYELSDEIKTAKGTHKKELQAKLETARTMIAERYGDQPPQVLRPVPALWQGYSESQPVVDASIIDGPFDAGLIVLQQVGGRRLSLESAGMVADAIRKTLMSRHGENPPEWLSGHAADGSPSTQRRPAYLPLSFVEREHADGHLLGVAITVPREFAKEQVALLYELLGRHGGKNSQDVEAGVPFLNLRVQNPVLNREIGLMELVADEAPERNPRINLKPSVWTAPSTTWATVTPVVLPRFPRRDLSPEDVVALACTDAGFPKPASIRVAYAPFLRGVPHARSFHTRVKDGLPPRPLMHAELKFSDHVRGPVIVGAGRYSGFGFCRPLQDEENA